LAQAFDKTLAVVALWLAALVLGRVDRRALISVGPDRPAPRRRAPFRSVGRSVGSTVVKSLGLRICRVWSR